MDYRNQTGVLHLNCWVQRLHEKGCHLAKPSRHQANWSLPERRRGPVYNRSHAYDNFSCLQWVLMPATGRLAYNEPSCHGSSSCLRLLLSAHGCCPTKRHCHFMSSSPSFASISPRHLPLHPLYETTAREFKSLSQDGRHRYCIQENTIGPTASRDQDRNLDMHPW